DDLADQERGDDAGRRAEHDQGEHRCEGAAIGTEQSQHPSPIGPLPGGEREVAAPAAGATAHPAAHAAVGHHRPWWRATWWAAAWARGRTVTRSRFTWWGALSA